MLKSGHFKVPAAVTVILAKQLAVAGCGPSAQPAQPTEATQEKQPEGRDFYHTAVHIINGLSKLYCRIKWLTY